ncbi:SMI1/KNR4 family protein [Streptomyces albipurpureus]|uniref:SMI1/KNR4 family protein n=1 Tax=Streptomyces albipurpureus TaxID=2897419 RepID=A0ABT0UMD8_9ACTN|nr:SMI1/KNR4 family protein [Streptomyces sp. CWNU-1]MCM2389787.1 SMI1/KNR4 family protein [Streptomyces sp. CWNU-1]
MDDNEDVLRAVQRLARPGMGDLHCDEAGHSANHCCLALSERTPLPMLQDALSARYGQPRNLAMDGYVDPTVTERTGLPLLVPFGERVVEMRAWTYGSRWIGCGTIQFGNGIRPVVLVAEEQDPAAELPEGASWAEGVIAATGWDTTRARTVDWAAAEARLGTALPSDYKWLAEMFGHGAFDEYLELFVPGACFSSRDIILNTKRSGEWARTNSGDLWEPYDVYPAPGGLLEWAHSEQADQFFWLTEGLDPDRWPILATPDLPDSWVRFDGTTTEFIYRILTERQHPFSTARYFDSHWFQSCESEG